MHTAFHDTSSISNCPLINGLYQITIKRLLVLVITVLYTASYICVDNLASSIELHIRIDNVVSGYMKLVSYILTFTFIYGITFVKCIQK